MTNHRKLTTYMLLALVAGALLAGAFTHITYPCPPHSDETGSHCVSFETAVMHPIDLAANTQNSLTQFLLKFLVVFVTILTLLIASHAAWAWAKERRSH
jgi:ABC-type transport system involved in multi-copper enzyme maturation permease subunit